MASFNIVTDSTSDLSREELTGAGIKVVPLRVQFGLESLRDGVDIDAAGWQKRLAAKLRPTTSQPSMGDFAACYADLHGPILSIHLSSGISGTVDAARAVAASLPGREINVIDSCSASAGLGYQVLAAAGVAAAGGTLEEALTAMEAVRQRISIYFMVDSLDYLQRGGRIGRAQAWAGIALQIKPLLQFEDGAIRPFERVRTRAQALRRLSELAVAGKPDRISIVNFLGEESALELALLLRAAGLEPEIRRISCVLGTHIGPGAVGVIFTGRSTS